MKSNAFLAAARALVLASCFAGSARAQSAATCSYFDGATAIRAGGSHSLAIKDNAVWAWGANNAGQLGNGNFIGFTVPIRVPGTDGASAISAGFAHSIAVKSADGSVWGWGGNSGQLGDGTVFERPTPVHVLTADPAHAGQTLPLTGFVDVASGTVHNLALKSDGTVWSWGQNSAGQLGLGDTSTRFLARPIAGLPSITAISATGNNSLAIGADGTLWVFGANNAGQLGQGFVAPGKPDLVNRLSPVQVKGLPLPVVRAVPGGASFALLTDGSVWSWGGNGAGALGVDGSVPLGAIRPLPIQVLGPAGSGLLTGASDVILGASGALQSVGGSLNVLMWGSNGVGQLGYSPNKPPPNPPFTSSPPNLPFSTVPNYVTTNPDRPAGSAAVLLDLNVPGATVASPRAVSSGQMLALRSDGTIAAWGSNAAGQLGIGTVAGVTTAVQVVQSGGGALSNIVAVAGGNVHALALAADGSVHGWGGNNAGQLGNGTLINQWSAVQTAGIAGASAIAAGGGHSLALLPVDGALAGTVWTWGSNGNGQMGVGLGPAALPFEKTPVRVLTGPATPLTGVVAVAGGGSHSLALAADGTLLSWGNDIQGQLGAAGYSIAQTYAQPVPAFSSSPIVALAAGNQHSLALTADGLVWTWGDNVFGELGIDPTKPPPGSPAGTPPLVKRYAPQPVLLDSSNPSSAPLNLLVPGHSEVAPTVAAGNTYSLAVKSDGSVWAWGTNSFGGMGIGGGHAPGSNVLIPINVFHPVQVVDPGDASGFLGLGAPGASLATPAVSIDRSGGALSIALRSDGSARTWGGNVSGQLCDGTITTRPSPVQPQGPGGALAGVIAIAASSGPNSIFLRSDHTVWTCGVDVSGQLGNGTAIVNYQVANVAVASITCPPDVDVGNDPGQCSASIDPGVASARIGCNPIGVSASRTDGLALGAPFPVGNTTVTWTGADSFGNSASCAQSVTVRDVEPPVFDAASASPAVLWPPDHTLQPVAVTVAAHDNCDPAPVTSIAGVTSSESADARGSGNTAPDWQVVDSLDALLRAERSGSGTGRVYTLGLECTDASGNVASQDVIVTVPHDQGQ